jgi:hypothetical protein
VKIFFIAATVAMGISPVHAGEVPIPQCPSELKIQQAVQSQADDGWKIVNSERALPVDFIAIAAGEYPVAQTGFEIPSKEIKQSNGDVIVYHDYITPFKGGDHDYWAVCGYVKSDIVLVQKIPENVRRCEIKYLNHHIAPDRVTIKCFDTQRKQ